MFGTTFHSRNLRKQVRNHAMHFGQNSLRFVETLLRGEKQVGTMPDGEEHQGSRKVHPAEGVEGDVVPIHRTERRKTGITDTNIPMFVHDNVDFHIERLRERKRALLVELHELNVELVKHETLRDVTGP